MDDADNFARRGSHVVILRVKMISGRFDSDVGAYECGEAVPDAG